MSGHSKWSKVKHQKAVTDAVKGQSFTKAAHAITTAVREGGGVADPNFNFRLRLSIEKARAINMPKENILRAIERGQGTEGNLLESVTYEGYGPGGVAIIIETTTDNKQRTVSAVKNILERHGGSLASPGAVNYLFRQTGVITIPKTNLSFDQLFGIALEAGASDVVEFDDMFEVYTAPTDLHLVMEKLQSSGVAIDNTSLIMHPTTLISLTPEKEEILSQVHEGLEALEDVQSVYTNAA